MRVDLADIPEVSYAHAGAVAVAYQVVGTGPTDLVFPTFLANLFAVWLDPELRRFFEHLSTETRLVLLNPRGIGLSDRPRGVTLEARMEDILAVLEALGIARASLLGIAESANVCALFAATYPERCERLVLYAPYARGLRSAEYPYGPTEEQARAYLAKTRAHYGERDFLRELLKAVSPDRAIDERDLDRLVWSQRLAASPSAAVEFWRMTFDTDITPILGSIRMPTLVLYRADARDRAEHVATRISGARSLQLPGRGVDIAQDLTVADATLAFLRDEAPAVVPDSVLVTILFTDIVDSTAHASRLGDRGWKELLQRHHAAVRSELARYRGTELDVAGDGFFCRFDGPARAIACARAIVQSVAGLGLDIRAGIHTGECEVVGAKVAGLAVNIGARIAATAGPRDVLVSSTVKDLVAGSGFRFDDRGDRQLKGIPGSWRLYAVAG